MPTSHIKNISNTRFSNLLPSFRCAGYILRSDSCIRCIISLNEGCHLHLQSSTNVLHNAINIMCVFEFSSFIFIFILKIFVTFLFSQVVKPRVQDCTIDWINGSPSASSSKNRLWFDQNKIHSQQWQ